MLFGAVGFLLLIVGIYSVFRNRGVVLTRGIEVPNNPNVRFHSMITVRLGNNGEIQQCHQQHGWLRPLATRASHPRLRASPEKWWSLLSYSLDNGRAFRAGRRPLPSLTTSQCWRNEGFCSGAVRTRNLLIIRCRRHAADENAVHPRFINRLGRHQPNRKCVMILP